VIRDINKNSNNVMARQLFLALGSCDEAATGCQEAGAAAAAAQVEVPAAEDAAAPLPADPDLAPAAGVEPPAPAPSESPDETARGAEPPRASALGTARSARFLHAWLARAGLPMPGLVLENGSGLSRRETIRPADLARLLVRAWADPSIPDFLASLPRAGVDGTMKSRLAEGPAVYVKTGLLSDARAVAGYVTTPSGRHYAVVGIVNGPGAPASQEALDAFLRWVVRKG